MLLSGLDNYLYNFIMAFTFCVSNYLAKFKYKLVRCTSVIEN